MTYKDGWIIVNDVPSRFLTWGSWVENLEANRSVVFLISGNPGITEFYVEFLTELYENLKIPVWTVCHAGHEISSNSEKINLYDLQQQIDHKAEIIRKFVPSGCRLYIIGHSMGAKIALELLKIPEIDEKIEKCYMLFPTVERIAETPNASFMKPFIKYFGSILVFLSWVFTLLPFVLRYYLVQVTFRLAYGASNTYTTHGGLKLVQPLILKNIFYLVKDEMEKIKELDIKTLINSKNKLKFYFGTTDGWSPLKYYSNLKEQIPEIDAVVCDKGMRHAFTIKSSSLMASMISDWVHQSKKEAVD